MLSIPFPWSPKGGGWKCHIKYKGLDFFTSFLSMQYMCRCQLTAIAWHASHEAITARWHLYVCCLLRKEVKQSSPLYLIWYFQPPPFLVVPSPSSSLTPYLTFLVLPSLLSPNYNQTRCSRGSSTISLVTHYLRETVPSHTSDTGKKTVSVLVHSFFLP